MFNTLLKAGKERGIKIRIVQSKPDNPPVADTVDLAKNGRNFIYIVLYGLGYSKSYKMIYAQCRLRHPHDDHMV